MTQIFKSQHGADEVRRRYSALLDRWPVPAEHLTIRAGAGETFMLASGSVDAPPVVLLHGSGANASVWAGDIATWATEFRVYAVDMLGEPGRSAEARLDLATDATAAWLDDVLDGIGVEKAVFVGMSLGGWTALDYTIRRPTRVSGLALLCPGGIGKQTWGWVPKSLLLGALGTRGRRRAVQLVAGLEGADMSAALDDVTLVFSHFKPRTGTLPIFSDAALQSVSIPLHLIVGADDVMMNSAETADRVARCIPDASVTVLPGVGHAILGQTDRIMGFLRHQ